MDREEETIIGRREFINKSVRTVGALGFGSGLLSLSGCSNNFSTDKNRPNIILITADDMGWKDLSCYGNQDIHTKSIDSLAKGGVKFTNAFVVTSTCSSSRAGLLTGQYPHTNGVTGLTHRYMTRQLKPFYNPYLPSLLKEAGYNTAILGKNHVHPYLPTSWYGYNERRTGLGFNDDDWKIEDANESIDYIRKNKNNRFYLELNFIQNHRIKKGQFFYDPKFPVDPDKVKVPDYYALPNWKEIREDLAKYYSQTLKMDYVIGSILKELDSLKLSDNTMIIFMSDNGAPFPGNKLTLYDRGTGTPVIIRWPKKIKPGYVADNLINSIDIMPTILDAANIDKPISVQGKSFWKNATGESSSWNQDAVFTEMTNHVFYIPTRAVRTKEWKYIRNYSDIAIGLDEIHREQWAHRLCQLKNQPWIRPRVQEELYYLGDDPNEQKNFVNDTLYTKKLEQMRFLLNAHMKNTKDPFLNKPFTHDYKESDYKLSKV